MQFNERIKQLRERENLTQKQMAEILDVSKSTYVKYERGEREPRYGVLVALSRYFDVTIDYILGKTDEANPYVYIVNELRDIIQSSQFKNTYGDNIRNAQKMIADYMQIVMIAEFDSSALDLMYPLIIIEKQMIALQSAGKHLFCYQKWAEEDSEYAEVVPKPSLDDMEEFLCRINELRRTLDDFIKLISSPSYHLDFKVPFEKEISEYADVNREYLMTQFKNDPRYKMRLKY